MSGRDHEALLLPDKLRNWLRQTIAAGASDLHLIAGYPPVLRLHGELTELPEPPLDDAESQALLAALLSPEAGARLEEQKNVDFSFELIEQGQANRFRAHLFQ